MPCSWWRKGPTVKTWVSSYLPKQEELENLYLIAVHQRNCTLWLLIHITSIQLLVIDVSSWILTSFVVMKGSRKVTYPVIHLSFQGKHDGKISSLCITPFVTISLSTWLSFFHTYCTNRSFCCYYFVVL